MRDTVFVVGIDTAVRILDPKYYSAAEGGLNGALAAIAAAGCRFMVAGRLVEGRYAAVTELEALTRGPNAVVRCPRDGVSSLLLSSLRVRACVRAWCALSERVRQVEARFAELFEPISEQRFRYDISSTELRAAAQAKSEG